MMKSAVFAGALVLGLASWANAQVQVTINFNNPQIDGTSPAQNGAIADYDPAGTTSYRLDYTNAVYYSNTDNWYGTTGFTNFSYGPGFGTWSVAIIPDAGMEVLLDQIVFGKGNSSTNTETINITTAGGSGGLAQAVSISRA